MTLLIGAVFFLPLAYIFAIKKTIEVHRQISKLNSKLEYIQEAPERIASVENRLSNLNQLFESNSLDGELQDRVLDEISYIGKQKGLLIKEMPPMIRTLDNNYMIEIINVQIAGSFRDLLQLIYLLENPVKNLNIVSLEFFVSENKRLKNKQLVLSLYVQTITPIML